MPGATPREPPLRPVGSRGVPGCSHPRQPSWTPGPHRTCADSLLSATLGSSLSSASVLQRLGSRSESGGCRQPSLTQLPVHSLTLLTSPPALHVHSFIHAFVHSCMFPVVHSSLIHSSTRSVTPSFIRHSPLTHSPPLLHAFILDPHLLTEAPTHPVLHGTGSSPRLALRVQDATEPSAVRGTLRRGHS